MTKYISIILLCVLTVGLFSSFIKDKIITNESLDHQMYLTYINYENAYDTSRVNYTVGELNLIYDDSLLINPIWNFQLTKQRIKETAIESNGIMHSLEEKARTVDIDINRDFDLEFFRDLRLQSNCFTKKIPGENENISRSIRRWDIGPNQILDDNIFQVLIKDSDTHEVLDTLDEIGVAKSTSSTYVTPIGRDLYEIDSNVIRRTYEYSPNHPKIYIAIRAIKSGPTSLGMRLYTTLPFINLSFYRGYTDEFNTKWSDSTINFITNLYKQRIYDHNDSLAIFHKRLSLNKRNYGIFFQGFYDEFSNRYMYKTYDSVHYHDTIWVMKDVVNTNKYSFIQQLKVDEPAHEVDLYPNPFLDELNIKINSFKEDFITVEIYNSESSLVKSKTLQGSNNIFVMDTHNLNHGAYYAIIKDKSGKVIAHNSILKSNY